MKKILNILTGSLVCLCAISVYAQEESSVEPRLIDNFEKQGNTFGGRSSTYMQAPSAVLAVRSEEIFHSDKRSLELKYKKAAEGGPYGKGGWCGYYTVIKDGPRKYYDASAYMYLTFWVKGEKGEENFKIGVADEVWDQREDSMKSEQIGAYLEAGKITTEWQKAKIPLEDFWVDTKKLASLAICFESECFPSGGGKGTIYIDDLQFE
ncbi:hypothetical protein KDK77_07905 [bacterium]|nr:hypothetical protein [bacterium]MCP5462588.1 hypothetical protein [bacterium]